MLFLLLRSVVCCWNLEQSVTDSPYMPLLSATSTAGLGRRFTSAQWCSPLIIGTLKKNHINMCAKNEKDYSTTKYDVLNASINAVLHFDL